MVSISKQIKKLQYKIRYLRAKRAIEKRKKAEKRLKSVKKGKKPWWY